MSRRLRGFARVYRASQWLRRRFTPAGRALLGLCAAAAVLGVDTRRTVAFQVFALSAALLAVAWSWSVRRREPQLALEREVPTLATLDVPLTYRYRLRCLGERPLAGLRLRDELAASWPTPDEFAREATGEDAPRNWVDRSIGYPRWLALLQRRRGADLDELALPPLAPGAAHESSVTVTPRRRGTLRFERVRLLWSDPLGLTNAVSNRELPGEIVVLPRIHPVPALALPGARRFQRGGVSQSSTVGDSQEFVQLREYRLGDALRNIHWRSFARRGEPVVKEFQDEYFTRYALVLDTFASAAGEPADAASFEAAVSIAASFVSALCTREALLDLMFVEDRAYRMTAGRGVGQPIELLRVLAAVEPAPHRDFALLAQQVLAQAPGLSACVTVLLGLDSPRSALVDGLRQRGVQQLVLVTGPGPSAAHEPGVHWIDPRDVAGALRRAMAPC
jgi:uncharacterized protein (DUF58 family)